MRRQQKHKKLNVIIPVIIGATTVLINVSKAQGISHIPQNKSNIQERVNSIRQKIKTEKGGANTEFIEAQYYPWRNWQNWQNWGNWQNGWGNY